MDPVFIQFLSVTPILSYFAEFYHQVIPHADPRTASWALMSSPDIPVSVAIVYLITVLTVNGVMRFLPIPKVNKVLVIYNSFVLTLNLWLGISLTWHIFRAGYQLGCQKVLGGGIHENAIASLLWIFHCSKIIELVDTLFLVLKRKESQLTFLHLYHHSTIVVATWIGVRFVPGGSSAVIAMVNSWIHVFMYFYYEMMVLNVKSFRSYKKFVTILQIVQFLATIVHCSTALSRDCGYPKWILTWLLLYMISFLVLFVHFYVQTYWKPKKEVCTDCPNYKGKGKVFPENEILGNNDRKCSSKSAFSDDEEEDAAVAAGVSSTSDYSSQAIDEALSERKRNGDIEGSNSDFDFVQWENLDDSDGDIISSGDSHSNGNESEDEETSDSSKCALTNF